MATGRALSRLSARDEGKAMGLASGQRRAKAAKMAGGWSRTVGRRTEAPAFRARADEMRVRAVERTVGAPSNLSGEAAVRPERFAGPFGVIWDCWGRSPWRSFPGPASPLVGKGQGR